MPKVRHTAVVTIRDAVPDLRHKRARKAAIYVAVHQRHIPRAAVDVALRLAGGDPSRLEFCDDGSVLVRNTSR